MRRAWLILAAAPLLSLVAPALAVDHLAELEAAFGRLKAIDAEEKGRPLVVKPGDARIVSFTLAAVALVKSGSTKTVDTLIDKLEEKCNNIYADHGVHFALRLALAEVPPGTPGDAEYKKRLKGEKSWQKQVALVWVARKRGPDAELDGILRGFAKQAPKLALQTHAIKALGERKCHEAVGELVDLLEKHEPTKSRLWFEAREALHAITGYDGDAKRWRTLLRDAKGKKLEGGGDTAFEPILEKLVPGERVVVAVDTSGSLHLRDPGPVPAPDEKDKKEKDKPEPPKDPKKLDKPKEAVPDRCPECQQAHGGLDLPPERMRIARAKDGAQKILKGLTKNKAKFNLIRFDNKCVTWQTRGTLIGASQHAVESAKDFLLPVEPRFLTTAMPQALDAAFATEDLDALWIITDGAPTSDLPNTPEGVAVDEVVAKARVLNRFRGVRIFTVGFKQAQGALLEVLAREHGGAVYGLE